MHKTSRLRWNQWLTEWMYPVEWCPEEVPECSDLMSQNRGKSKIETDLPAPWRGEERRPDLRSPSVPHLHRRNIYKYVWLPISSTCTSTMCNICRMVHLTWKMIILSKVYAKENFLNRHRRDKFRQASCKMIKTLNTD